MNASVSSMLTKSHIRWFIVGCLTFLIDTSAFLTLFYFTDWAVVSNLVSGTLATIFNYFSHYHWSFTSNREHKQSTLLYLIFFFIFLFLGTSLIHLLLDSGVSPFFAKVGTASCIAPVSFFIMKFVTFRRSSDAK
jgi:putative flippase GtrA